VPQPVDRHLADDRDRRGVDELGDVLPDEGHADDHLARLVDDHACGAGVAVRLQAHAGDPAHVVVDHADVEPGLRRRLGGEADARHLGVAERHLRHCGVVGGRDVGAPRCVIHGGALRPRCDHVAACSRLVLALVGEQRAVVHVAGRVQPVEALDQQGVVHGQPIARREADRLESDVGAARRAPGRDQHVLGEDRVAVDEDRDAVLCALDPLGLGLDDGDPEVAQSLRDHVTGEVLLAAEDAAARDDRDGGAERGVRRRHLDRHDAAPDDRETLRCDLRGRGIPRRPRRDGVEPWDRRDERIGARAHHDRVPRRELGDRAVVRGHAHALLSGDPAVAAQQPDAGVAHPVHLRLIVPVVHELVAACEDARNVQFARDGRARALDALGGAQCVPAAQQRLGRHAGPVRALPADELALDEQRGQAALHCAVGDVLRDRAAADDDDVVLGGTCRAVDLLRTHGSFLSTTGAPQPS
jgi:hypothetical protein